MTINFTIFLQALNFFIAYLIITKLLLKPAISIIKNEELVEREILNDIKNKELEIENKKFLKKSLWNQMIERFDKEKPKVSPLEVSILWRMPQIGDITEFVTKDLKEKLADFVIETVKHVK